jgi:hypothetical protein
MITYTIRRKKTEVTDYIVEAKNYDEAIMLIQNGDYISDDTITSDENYLIVERSSTVTNAIDFDMVNHWSYVNGTSLQGYMDISYDEIYNILGEPNIENDGYKVDAEWGIRFQDTGEVATIYNYKTGTNYLGAEGLDPQDIRDWHIGGHSKKIVARVCKLLNTKAVTMDRIFGGK